MQAEHATDIRFRSAAMLAPLYDHLLRTAILAVQVSDVATFPAAQRQDPEIAKPAATSRPAITSCTSNGMRACAPRSWLDHDVRQARLHSRREEVTGRCVRNAALSSSRLTHPIDGTLAFSVYSAYPHSNRSLGEGTDGAFAGWIVPYRSPSVQMGGTHRRILETWAGCGTCGRSV